jgi:hypothetical protein
MLIEARHQLENLPGPLSDLDLTPSGKWIGVTEFADGQALSFCGKTVLLPERCQFPKIAAIDEETAFLVNSRAWTENNGWIITSSGDVRAQFYAGDAIQDVLASSAFVVVTYFDESALTSSGIEGNGIAIFDVNGNFLFGYQDLFKSDAVRIADCYAAGWAGENRLLFFPYTEFPLVSFDLKSRTQEIWETPDAVVGSGAITMLDSRVYFHSPYNDEPGVYEWRIGSEAAERIGSYSSRLRGLRNGRFLAVEKFGYTVVSFAEI